MNALLVIATLLTQPTPSPATQPVSAPLDWKTLEQPFLSGHVQLTRPEQYVKAGEAYFDHFASPKWMVFQAIERPSGGEKASPHYAMYIGKLEREGGTMKLGRVERVSTSASANTCAWFAPHTFPGAEACLLFGSTISAPSEGGDTPGYSKDRSRYTWQFPPEMRVVTYVSSAIAKDVAGSVMATPGGVDAVHELIPPPNGPGYMAECSWSPDGRSVVYTYLDPQTKNPDLWVYDVATKASRPLVQAQGYDGGPFFSPDGKWICYRSDRKGDNNLQLFVAELAFDAAVPTKITGITREVQLTADEQIVSWCPFWHPSMKYMVYATSAVSHGNYEVFAIEFDAAKVRAVNAGELPVLRKARVTYADGFDGLPVFSDDGQYMMWTSQRGPKVEGEARPSSQLWIAKITGEPNWPMPEKP